MKIEEFINKYKIYELNEENKKELLELYSYLSDFNLNGNFEEYSYILENLEVPKIKSIVLLISFLRITFLRREEIKYWKTFLNKVSEELEDRGLNSEKLLKGLYQ